MLETIQQYFKDIPSLHRALLLAGGITFFWFIEIVAPLFNFKYNKFKRIHGQRFDAGFTR
jgi:hypothetical protein